MRYGNRGRRALDDANDDRDAARIMVDLVHPSLVFPLEAFKRGQDGDQKLHDDGGEDIWHDAERTEDK